MTFEHYAETALIEHSRIQRLAFNRHNQPTEKGTTMLTIQTAHRKDINTGIADMQHRHFATVATIIRDMRNNGALHLSNEDVDTIAEHFADELRDTNPKFDRKRFLAACSAS